MNIRLRKILGYLGALPFIFLSLMPIFSFFPEDYIFYLLLSIYGGVILSFLGGMTWGWNKPNVSPIYLIVGIFVSLVGFFVISISNMFLIYSLFISLLGFIGFYFFELQASDFMRDKGYKLLRRDLTIIVSLCYLLALYNFNY